MKPLLVGELNPYGADPEMALYPHPERASGGRLARILGLSRGEYLRRFDRVNLCVGRWSLPAARQRADTLCSTAESGEVFVLLGAKVAQAFGFAFEPFAVKEAGMRMRLRLSRFFILPHPSGRNRAWSDPTAQRRARGLLAEFLPQRRGEEEGSR